MARTSVVAPPLPSKVYGNFRERVPLMGLLYSCGGEGEGDLLARPVHNGFLGGEVCPAPTEVCSAWTQ